MGANRLCRDRLQLSKLVLEAPPRPTIERILARAATARGSRRERPKSKRLGYHDHWLVEDEEIGHKVSPTALWRGLRSGHSIPHRTAFPGGYRARRHRSADRLQREKNGSPGVIVGEVTRAGVRVGGLV